MRCRVFELPMRDGNLHTMQYCEVSPRVFELPMRDGNHHLTVERTASWPRFLNFLWGMETRVPPWEENSNKGFWTSYEGWKRSRSNWAKPAIMGFWTSYEGWKLVCAKCFIAFIGIVFELPMRDGNISIFSSYTAFRFGFWTSYEGWKPVYTIYLYTNPVKFLNFLWGMETLLSVMPMPPRIKFLNFLWGMETDPQLCRLHFLDRVFELPMRDGNFE